MSVQIFLEGRILGVEAFLALPGDPAVHAQRVEEWTGATPARFLTEQNLASILLGSSGGGQFLLVLPVEVREAADTFFAQAAAAVATESRGVARLVWASTENLGTWRMIRTRLDDELRRREGTPGFATQSSIASGDQAPERKIAAVLRGDVDHFSVLLGRAESIESYVALSVLFKRFFAGELARLCEGKAELLYAGGDDFAIAGEWQALIEIATEMNRLFERFVEENLKDSSGPEGKTLSMALEHKKGHASLAAVFAACGERLEEAKTATRGGFHLFGRTIEWAQLPEAVSIKDQALRLVREFKCSTAFIDELRGFYPETRHAGRKAVVKFDRPWRFWRRLAVTLDPNERRARSRDFTKLRDALAGEIIGKSVGQARLRPSGRVALEWAKLLTRE